MRKALGQELNILFTCGYCKLRLEPRGRSLRGILLPEGQDLKEWKLEVVGTGSDILHSNRKDS